MKFNLFLQIIKPKRMIIIIITLFSFSFAQHKMGNDMVVIVDGTGVKHDTSFVVRGTGIAEVYLRSISLRVKTGTTPGTHISVDDRSAADVTYNQVSITDAVDLTAAGSSGSFSLSADAKELTLTISETVTFVIMSSPYLCDINASDGSVAFPRAQVSSGNLILKIHPVPGSSASWLDQFDDAGDKYVFLVQYVTSD